MYLLDTNIWLERLLGQDNSEDVGRLLDQIRSDQLFITDFSFHSLCVILTRLNLDFDDAYQYVAAEQNNLVIVSFDSDFNKTPLGSKNPAEILAET